MDEKIMSFKRWEIFRESARFIITSKNMYNNNYNKNRNASNKKAIGCKCCHRLGYSDLVYPDKRCKKPPSMPLWANNATCMKCKKKGDLSFNSP